MKRMYDRTVAGYYTMSVILGLLLAVVVMTTLEVGVLGAMDGTQSYSELSKLIDLWGYLPLRALELDMVPTTVMSLVMVTTAIIVVGAFVRMSGGKNSRTKILQTVSTAMLVLLVLVAYNYALHSYMLKQNTVFALIPVLLTTIPLMILKKTQLPHESPMVLQRMREAWGRLSDGAEKAVKFGVIVLAVCFVLLVCYIFVDKIMPGVSW